MAKAARCDRLDTRCVAAHVERELHRSLKIVTATTGLTMDAFLHICISLGLEQFNTPTPKSLREKIQSVLAQIDRGSRLS